MQSDTDQDLWSKIRTGDERALYDLHQRHIAMVYRAGFRVLGQRLEAEEAAQDAFLQLWDDRRKVKIHGESALPWLIVTVKYKALNRARRLQREGKMLLDYPYEIASYDNVQQAVEQLETSDALRAALEKLSLKDRAIVVMCLVEGRTYDEAAGALGLSRGGVRNRLLRARGRLRETLAASGDG